MRLAKLLLASCWLWLAPKALASSYNANYYAVYEKPASGGSTVIYLVPKLSILIVASDVDIPIAFMPDIPSMSAILAANNTLGAFTVTSTHYTANDMAALGATASSYKIFGADFNGDGQQDLLLQGAGERESVVIVADASGNPSTYYSFGKTLNSAQVQISVGDFDGNGRADVLASQNGVQTTYLSSSDGAWFDTVDQAIASTSLIGSINGKFRVNEQGEATYSVDIMAALGTAGVTPRISLNYSSGSSDGIAGIGWSVGGLSSISRCRQTLSQDNNVAGIKLDGNDRFCLDGQRLILTSGAYGVGGSQYRTEIDSYAVVTAYGSTTGDPDYFKVERKDGSVSYYGKENNSAQRAIPGNSDSPRLSWAISSFEDSVGNPIKFSYIDDASGHRISRVDYAFGANKTAANADTYIEFVYKDRPDPRSAYMAGYALQQTKRLSSIRSVSGNVELRNYRLQYRGANSARPQSYVEKLYECVGSNCLAPTTFTWEIPQGGFVSAGSVGTLTGPSTTKIRAIDINGDGKADLVYMNTASPYAMYYRLWTGAGYGSAVALPSGLITDGNTNWQIFDFNNDGKQDLMVGSPGQNWKLFLGSSSGFQAYNGGGDTGITYYPDTSLIDVNSDGLPDMIYTNSNTAGAGQPKFRLAERYNIGNAWGYRFADESSLSLNFGIPPVPPGGGGQYVIANRASMAPGETIDYDVDGKVDIYAYVTTQWSSTGPIVPIMTSATRRALFSKTSTGDYEVVSWGAPIYLFSGRSLPNITDFDLNHDGLPDQLNLLPESFTLNTNWTWRFSLNTGAGFAPEVILGYQADLPDLQTIDFNGDGYPDLTYSSGSNLAVRLFNSVTQTFDSAIVTNIPFQSSSSDQYLFVDIDGDGHPDILRANTASPGSSNTELTWYKSVDAGKASNRIARINNGFGNITDITYGRMTDSNVYTPATDANSEKWQDGAAKPYPVFDLLTPSYVVASVRSTAPAAGDNPGAVNYSATSSISYHYSGDKAQSSGRGYLGFATIETTDGQSGVVTKTTYHQDFPFIGQPIETEVKSGNVVIKLSRNYTSVREVAALGGRYYQPYVFKVTELSGDPLTGAEVGYVETVSSAPDVWGNVGTITSSTFNAISHTSFLTQTITNNTYGNSDWEKRYGRLTRTQVTHKRNDVCVNENEVCPDIVRASAFTYYGETEGYLKGLLKSEIVEPDGAAIATTYEYDAFGNKTKATRSAAGLTSRYTRTVYDGNGRYAVTSSSPFFNGSGWIEQITEQVISRNAYGSPLQSQGLNGVVTHFTYDQLGREASRSDNSGASLTTSYSKFGLVFGAVYKVIATTSTGARAEEHFDALGRSIAKTQLGFDGSVISTETEYDNASRVRRQSQPHFSTAPAIWVENSYDAFGRLTAVSVPAANNAVATTSTEFQGLNTITTNALGQTRKEWRNAAGELIKVEDFLGGSVSYRYDARGQLIKTTTTDATAQVVLSNHLSYDLLGRKIKQVDSDKGTWFYQYNAFGELTDQYKVTANEHRNYGGDLATAQANSVPMQRTRMDYDQRGRMTKRTDYREDNSVEGEANWSYDTASNGLGQLVAESGGGLARSYSYDSLGRVSATLHNDGNGSYLQTVSYDATGRVQSQTDALGTGSGTVNSYNAFGYLQAVSDLATGTVLYQAQNMDARGNVTTAVLGNGATSTWNYDERTGLLLNQSAVAGAYTLQNLSYTWDVLGNQTSRRDRGLISTASNTYRDVQQRFCYDGLNRLIKTYQGSLSGSCGMSAAQQDQQYDGFGNITAKTGIGAYTYLPLTPDETKRPNALQSTGDGVSYTYDATGNLISDTSGRTLHYTVFDKPDVIAKYNNQISFAYGPDRAFYKRVDTDTNTGQSTTTYTIGNVEKVIKPDGSYDMRRYLAGVAIWTQHFSGAGAQTGVDKQYLYSDVLGSVVLITDHLAVIKQQSAYNAWGERVSVSDWQTVQPGSSFLPVSAQFTNKGFSGHEMLDAVGLIHMRGRIFDPKLGRFVQADPFVQDASYTQAYNRYAYVLNNPMSMVDPTGYWGGFLGKLADHAMKFTLSYNLFKNMSPAFAQLIVSVASKGCGYFQALCAAGGTYTNARAHGASMDSSAKAAVIAGVSSYAFSQLDEVFDVSPVKAFIQDGVTAGTVEYAVADTVVHGFVGGVMSYVSGGKFGDGFASASLSTALSFSDIVGGSGAVAGAERVLLSAVSGGTVSSMTGGKFANGAMSSAFQAVMLSGVSGRGAESQGSRPRDSWGNALLDVAGKIWNLPNTILGLAYGGMGSIVGGVGYMMGKLPRPSVSLGHNAIQFLNNPLNVEDGSALTLGNAISYKRVSPQDLGSYGDFSVQFGLHEEAHTYQSQVLGPLFLPVYFMRGGVSGPERNPFEKAAQDYGRGEGGWWR